MEQLSGWLPDRSCLNIRLDEINNNVAQLPLICNITCDISEANRSGIEDPNKSQKSQRLP